MVKSSCQETGQAWRCSNKPWPIGLSWNRPGRGDARPTLTQNVANCTGTLPKRTPGTIEGRARASKSLIHTPILLRNGFIHTQSGSILIRILLATRGTTNDSLALFSVRREPIIRGRQFVAGSPNTSNNESSWKDNSWRGEPSAPNNESWVDQSWLSNAPRAQGSTRMNQSNSYFEEEDHEDAYKGMPDSYIDYNEDDLYAAQIWWTPPPSYDSVRRPESLRQPYHMEQYAHEIETVDRLPHLGTFGMKPPYRSGTHEDILLATEYTKLDPQVLLIASSAMAGQRRGHQFLSSGNKAVVSKTNATIYELRCIVDIDSWRKTAPFPYETM